jgi:hypothetical protein
MPTTNGRNTRFSSFFSITALLSGIRTRRGIAGSMTAFGVGLLGLGTTAVSTIAALAPVQVAQAAQESTFVATKTSKLGGFTLPGNAETTQDKQMLEKMRASIQQVADKVKREVGEAEMLGWDIKEGKNPSIKEVKEPFLAVLKSSGFTYEELPGDSTKNTSIMTLHPFVAKKSGAMLGGYWIEHTDGIVLCWAKLTAQESVDAVLSKGSVPASLLGSWRATRISGSSVYNRYSGAYGGSGGTNMSMTYEFRKDGTYKLYNYINSYLAGRRLETYTWEDGKFSVSGDRIILRATGGKYKVVDSSVASNNYTRPMTAKEVAKSVTRWYFKPGNGSSIRMGSNLSDLIEFKKTE